MENQEENISAKFSSFEEFAKSYQLGKIWLLSESDFTQDELLRMIELKVSQCQVDLIIIDNNKYWLVNK